MVYATGKRGIRKLKGYFVISLNKDMPGMKEHGRVCRAGDGILQANEFREPDKTLPWGFAVFSSVTLQRWYDVLLECTLSPQPHASALTCGAVLSSCLFHFVTFQPRSSGEPRVISLPHSLSLASHGGGEQKRESQGLLSLLSSKIRKFISKQASSRISLKFCIACLTT